MGYRARLGKIAKAEREKYRGKTEEEVNAMMQDDEAPYRLKAHTQLYEIGKYVNLKGESEPFYDFELDENEFHILTKEQLKNIIDWYHKSTYDYYNKLLNEIENGKYESVYSHIHSMLMEWEKNDWNITPYWLDQKHTDGFIVQSWKIEYSIFNIVYIYHSFDWENDYLIYSGW